MANIAGKLELRSGCAEIIKGLHGSIVRALMRSVVDHAMPIKERLEGFDDGETVEATGFFDPTPNGLGW